VQRGAADALVNEEATPEQAHAVTDGHNSNDDNAVFVVDHHFWLS